jgi:DNA-binding PadR family transcriptional regulator
MRFQTYGCETSSRHKHPFLAVFGGHYGGGRHRRPDDFEAGKPRRRFFDQGDLRLVLLKLIADEPRHGYDCIRAIEDLTGGSYAPSPGVIYPTLSLLEEMGFVTEASGDEKRRKFAITDAGAAHLLENATLVAALVARMQGAGDARTRSEAAPVRRAMGNLRHVLMQRLGDADKDMSLAIAAMLDDAAQKIERL